MRFSAAKEWHIDVDRYTNPWTPRNPIYLLPRPIAHFLGHRDRPANEIGNVIVAAWALLGAFVGVVVIAATFMIPDIKSLSPPIVIGSFGAAAVLEYNTIESPLAQPRNSILGHFFSATVGVAITKLFKLNSNFENLRWLAGGLSCGSASAVMTLSKTIYPPAGATALLASIDPQVEALGWYLLPLVLLSSTTTLVTSLLLNNIQRRYPTYWWTPADLAKTKEGKDIEKLPSNASQGTMSTSSSQAYVKPIEDLARLTIKITPENIVVPAHLYLASEEERILEILRDRLRESVAQPRQST